MREISGDNPILILETIILYVNINEKFVGERGRINCSLRDQVDFGDGLEYNL